MSAEKQKNQTGGSGFFDSVQLVGKNVKDNNTEDKQQPKKQSLRKAINEHCKSCGYDPLSGLGTWRKQIEDCPCTSCYLFPVRPRVTSKRAISGPETAKVQS